MTIENVICNKSIITLSQVVTFQFTTNHTILFILLKHGDRHTFIYHLNLLMFFLQYILTAHIMKRHFNYSYYKVAKSKCNFYQECFNLICLICHQLLHHLNKPFQASQVPRVKCFLLYHFINCIFCYFQYPKNKRRHN